ncbi:riboflavin synthase [Myceligenerans pegani]|uniref:Riboflavin synthase n=1 Tax=Myceligenerans pegani TaxID=2776917 RepID=A0ABR9MUA6_9MICO|nr:riboflavin synthase [Myceligenerans sp. TRM 65318]MBE1874962.1 riboflavin synthase [Myceligenerans sp. TRM 65318]MBE3017233.1 riboflavin synthase [Myceligenerans sp. TRM 65318]
MFTGIVEETGTVRSLVHPDEAGTDAILTVVAPLAASDARLGDSIAVDGVCLTVTDVSDDATTGSEHTLAFEVMPETLRRSTLGALNPAARVNLERALPANGRLGGHVVQGHVDGTATLVERRPGPRWDELTFAGEPALLRYVAEKGSIALNGVSLTVTHVSDPAAHDAGPAGQARGDGQGTFGVSLIPTTLEATNLGELAPGSAVNVEVDVLAKYTERLLTAAGARSAADASVPNLEVRA